MTALPASYDNWRLAGPDDDTFEIGTEEGDTCNRMPDEDEDAPRNWRPRPCGGLMMVTRDGDIACESCGCSA